MLLLWLPIASSIHVTSLPASCILYWLSETVFSFDGDSHANVSAEQGMTWSSLLPTRPSWISSYLPFSALSLSERNHYTVQSTNRFSLNIRHSTQVDQSRVLQTFKSLFHNQLPSAATDEFESLGLILHRIEIFILNEMSCLAQARVNPSSKLVSSLFGDFLIQVHIDKK